MHEQGLQVQWLWIGCVTQRLAWLHHVPGLGQPPRGGI